MTDADFAVEQGLRAQAIKGLPGAADALADFYDERRQWSRAALWRSPDRDARTEGERDRTCLKTIANPSPVDPRRNAMIWLLCFVGISPKTIGAPLKLSGERVRMVSRGVDRELYFEALTAFRRMDVVTKRLRAVRALSLKIEADAHVEIPPETWPYTREHEKQRMPR